MLTAEEHRQLKALTTTFAGIFQKAVAALAGDTAALERMGFPWLASELLAQEAVHEAGPLLVGRFDFLLERTGTWQLVEYNADTPSGLRETVATEPLIARHAGIGDASLSRPIAGTGRQLGRAVRRAFARTMGTGGVLGLVTDAGYAEDLAQTVFLARLLAGLPGLDVLVGDVDNLALRGGRLALLNRPLDALYRYYPFETLLGQQAFADLFGAVATGGVRLLNGLRGLLAQNKGVMAWIWARRDDDRRFTAAERRAICRHLPETWWIEERERFGSGEASDVARGVVLKQVFGREGEEVYFGDALTAEEWRRCRTWGSYVVQRRVETVALQAAIRTSAGPTTETLWPTVGSFTVEGRWAGYYTRLGAPITTAHAKYVGTFVERPAG